MTELLMAEETTQSAGFLNNLKNIADNFINFITVDYAVHAVELIFASVLIYFVFKVIQEGNIRGFTGLYCLIVVLTSVLTLLVGAITLTLYLTFIMLVTMFFLLLFSTDLKRALLKARVKQRSNFVKEDKTRAETEACISSIIKAVQDMSKSNTGALIVFSCGKMPDGVIESGVGLNADISSQLIEGLFVNKAPLHDGAIIIRGHKIIAAGCFLPLSQKEDLPNYLGTRHRAAIGITDVTDAIAIVVSEETGIISIFTANSSKQYADYSILRNTLTEYYWSDLNEKN